MNEGNGLAIGDWDAPIYRVFSKDRFMELLDKKRNALLHPSKWEDPFENFLMKSRVTDPGGLEMGLEPLYRRWYGQCWTMNRDSDAMWRIYSPGKDGVRVRTTIRKLFSSLYDMTDQFAALSYFIGTVAYWGRDEIEDLPNRISFTDLAMGGSAHPFAEILCIKRLEFSHEKEVRLLCNDVNDGRGVKGVLEYPIDPQALFDEVALDPRMQPATFAGARDELKANGCMINIIQSDLYKFSPMKFRIE